MGNRRFFFKAVFVGSLFSMIACTNESQQNQNMEKVEPVTIKQEEDGFQLYRNEEPYFIKGARIIAN
jgi:hypothetical protein